MLTDPHIPFIESRYGGSALTATPFYLINHSLEAPAKKGMARSLAGGWFRDPSNETSVHAVNDPGEAIGTFDLQRQVWGCGTGNKYGFQFEHTGYAAWSAAQWRSADSLSCLKLSAAVQAWVWYTVVMKKYGVDYYPDWLSLTEIAGRKKWGLVTHNDMRLVFGGTTHTDPGKNFPYAELKNYIWAELDKLTGKNTKPAKPTKPSQTVDKKGTYTVRKGDTLSGIASALLGKAALYTSIAKLNNLKDPNKITVGQVLKIPAKGIPSTPASKYTAPPQSKFPLARTDYFGDINGGKRSHGGYYANEKPYVKWIQTRMYELGYVSKAAWNNGKWADGKFGPATIKAVTAWQKDMHANTTALFGQVWWDDWANLIKDR